MQGTKFHSKNSRSFAALSRYKLEKGYGKWWGKLFPVVGSRESSDRSNNIETSADTDSGENNSFEGTVPEELD